MTTTIVVPTNDATIDPISVQTLSVTGITDITTGVIYNTVSAAITGSNAGDVIQIPGGLYQEDFPKITHDLTLEGIGSFAHLESISGQSPSNGQGILVTDANVTVDGIELSGSTVPDGNGAGIREESGSLTVLNSFIHDNQDGILTSGVLTGATLTIDHSEFDHNGSGTGSTHNLYVGQVDTLSVKNSYLHNAVVGHEIKSRALVSDIENNRIQDENGSASYNIDLPNGNVGIVKNNVLEKGVNSENPSFIHFGGEVATVAAGSSLDIENNVVINDKGTSPFVLDQASLAAGGFVIPTISGNTFYGLTADQLVNNIPGSTYPNNTFSAIGNAPALDTSSPTIIPCFMRGTRILTIKGPVKVEDLRVGDKVISTLKGQIIPIIWIGQKSLHCQHHPSPQDVLPVRISRDAFADDQPWCDLFLSPEHSVYVDKVLIPIRYLVNGTTIRYEPLDFVTYFHIELPSHNVLIVENLPAESYLDTGYRWSFANNGPEQNVADDYADQVWAEKGCAQLIKSGEKLEAVKARLRERTLTFA